MDQQFIKDIAVPVIAGLILSFITGSAAATWLGIRWVAGKLFRGQEDIRERLDDIKEDIGNRVTKLEERELMRDRIDRDRHQENRAIIISLQESVHRLQQRRG